MPDKKHNFVLTRITREVGNYPKFGDASYGMAHTCTMSYQATGGLYFAKCSGCGAQMIVALGGSGVLTLGCRAPHYQATLSTATTR